MLCVFVVRLTGLNEFPVTSGDVLSFFFSDYLVFSRDAIYNFIYFDGLLNGRNNPLSRYILLNVIEIAAVNVNGKERIDLNYLYYKLLNDTNIKLRYLGTKHTDIENGNLVSKKDEINASEIFDKKFITRKEYNNYFKAVKDCLNGLIKHWKGLVNFVTKDYKDEKDIYKDILL